MTLQSSPDHIDDTVHVELDGTVNDTISQILRDPAILPPEYIIVVLLTCIVECSNGDLDPEYARMSVASTLITAQEELKAMLLTAWETKSYRDIRNLTILKAPRSVPKPFEPASTSSVQNLQHTLSLSFKDKYRGAAVDGFHEYLTHNEKLFRTTSDPSYYAKFCSIVQSSGTGKSRVMTELYKKDVVVIYLNLREKSDNMSFPLRDPIPSQILTQFPSKEGEYQSVCYAFFIALFDAIEERLSTAYPTRNAKKDVMKWVATMCDLSDPSNPDTARKRFFDKVAKKYEEAYASLGDNVRTDASNDSSKQDAGARDVSTAGTDADQVADTFKKLTVTGPASASKSLFDAYIKMATSLEKIFPDKSDRPKLVIAVDEAHSLTMVYTDKTDSYRPADVFCRVVNEYSHNANRPVWVVFASTASDVADFSPPNQKHNSARIAIDGQKLFPPYTQLGWDQSAPALGGIPAEDVSKLCHIVGYGRPLWVSLRSAIDVPPRVLNTASFKLCGAGDFKASEPSHVLAVLGQRFGLNVTFGHPDSVEHLERGVASHLRMCLATTLDRTWRFTNYPSEPLLSCVAARVLHKLPGSLEASLTMLMNIVNSGMIDIGQRGELGSRLLWLLAKDLFVRTLDEASNKFPSSWDDHLLDCQMISVVDWLEFVFGPKVWEDAQGSAIRAMFKDAYLNFSHWVCMEQNIGSLGGDNLKLDMWTLRHWQRTSGVQCCHLQPLVDKVIPIYFKDGQEGVSAQSRMSQILISDKAGKSGRSETELKAITRRDVTICGKWKGEFDSLPYIAILVDLGQPSKLSVTFPKESINLRSPSDRCLRIYAAGTDSTTYPFLDRYPALMKTLQDLVHIQRMPEFKTPFTHYLDAQVKFGSTASPEHMEWERGREVPNWPKRKESSP